MSMLFKTALQQHCVLLFSICVLSASPWITVSAAALHTTPLLPTAGDHAHSGRTDGYSSEGAPTSPTVDATEAKEPTRLSPDQLVHQVWLRNPGIDAMRAAAAGASAKIESAGSLEDPMVSYAIAPRTAGEYPIPNQNVQISQRLPWPGTLTLRRKVAEADAESTEEEVVDLRLRLAARARADYAQWYYVHRALAINAQNQALVTRLRSVAEAAYAAGQSQQQDVLQAEVELTRLNNQANGLASLRQTVQAKINALQDLPPDTEVSSPADIPSERPLPPSAELQNAALAHYPMLKSLDARVNASRNGVDLAYKGYYPKLNVSAGYNSEWDLPSKRLTVGVAVSIPFGGNHRGEVGQANAQLQEDEAKLADARNQLLSDIDETCATAAQAATTIQLYTQKLLPLTKLNMQAAEADYSSGSGDFLKLITAEQQYLTAQLELARARADFYTQWASLDYQTGGMLWPSSVPTSSEDTTP
jgi:Outer membrane protein